MTFNLKLRNSLLFIFSLINIINGEYNVNKYNVNTQNLKEYKNYYYYQKLELSIYNNSNDCNNYNDDDTNLSKYMSIYFFIDCGCIMDKCFNKLLSSQQFMTANYSEPDYNISKCIYDNYKNMDYSCIKCEAPNNTSIYFNADLFFYNYYCILGNFIIGALVFILILGCIVLVVMKNEKKIILIKQKRQYNPI